MNAKKIIMYGADWCGDCRRAKQFFQTFGVEYEWINTDNNPEAQEIITKLNHGLRRIPTIIFEDGSILVEPTNLQLAEKLKLEL